MGSFVLPSCTKMGSTKCAGDSQFSRIADRNVSLRRLRRGRDGRSFFCLWLVLWCFWERGGLREGEWCCGEKVREDGDGGGGGGQKKQRRLSRALLTCGVTMGVPTGTPGCRGSRIGVFVFV